MRTWALSSKLFENGVKSPPPPNAIRVKRDKDNAVLTFIQIPIILKLGFEPGSISESNPSQTINPGTYYTVTKNRLQTQEGKKVFLRKKSDLGLLLI